MFKDETNVVPPADIDVILCAPKGSGTTVVCFPYMYMHMLVGAFLDFTVDCASYMYMHMLKDVVVDLLWCVSRTCMCVCWLAWS